MHNLDPTQYADNDRREVDPPVEVQVATWSPAGTLDWWSYCDLPGHKTAVESAARSRRRSAKAVTDEGARRLRNAYRASIGLPSEEEEAEESKRFLRRLGITAYADGTFKVSGSDDLSAAVPVSAAAIAVVFVGTADGRRDRAPRRAFLR